MKGIQLEFDLIYQDMFISNTCGTCKNKCKVYCVTKGAEIYCNRYKKAS